MISSARFSDCGATLTRIASTVGATETEGFTRRDTGSPAAASVAVESASPKSHNREHRMACVPPAVPQCNVRSRRVNVELARHPPCSVFDHGASLLPVAKGSSRGAGPSRDRRVAAWKLLRSMLLLGGRTLHGDSD